MAPAKIGRYASSRLRISSREPRKRSSNPTYFQAPKRPCVALPAPVAGAPAAARLRSRRRRLPSAGVVPIRSTSRFSAMVAWCSTAIASRNSRLDSACAAPIAVALRVEALLARDHRLPALEDLVGQAGDGAVEGDVAVADVAGELEVLGVDEAGELLEVDDQRRVERAQLAERVGGEAQGRVDRLAGGAIDRDAAVDVIDQRRVEGLLALEGRRDHAPREAARPCAAASCRRRAAPPARSASAR